MQRRKPISAKQRKAQLQQKRAIKRGDVSPPPPLVKHKGRRGPPASGQSSRNTPATVSSRKLQSSFVRLSRTFLDTTKHLATEIPLPRPIPTEAAIWTDASGHDDPSKEPNAQLSCPKRPKWRYDQTKLEVEKNEEGLFKKWLEQTSAAVENAFNQIPASEPASDEEVKPLEPNVMPSAPASFEQNLEVWRQLWRVTEISQILLILLDSRCPLLHYPPSLDAYLSSPHLAQKRKIIVLTKVDVSGPTRVASWTRYLNDKYPDIRVVQVEAYIIKNSSSDSSKRKVYEPHLPSEFRETLVNVLRSTHADLLEPPERIKEAPEKLRAWKPPVKKEVNWDAVLHAQGALVGSVVGGPTAPHSRDIEHKDTPHEDETELESENEPEFLTIGLIGQPNVGKSSLLNALFGTQKVRASKTPGKTKHFQTLFWTPEVRLVDCPGLVMPNLHPMETQVLSGILPISRVSAVPLCIHHAARLLPLEQVFGLSHPALAETPREDKRTWREPRDTSSQSKELVWTGMDILTAFALKKGWVTAKAGRPDVNRAGNWILRALAEGRIRWAFWPPDTPASVLQTHQSQGTGIWIPHPSSEDYDSDLESDGSEDEKVHDPAESDDDTALSKASAEDESEEEVSRPPATAGGRFGALLVNEGDESESEN